jgi:ABC-type transport system involved in cytochrome c biogenesis permease component
MFLFCVSTVLVAPIIRGNWQDKPKTKQQSETEDFFCKPVFWTGAFRAWMRRSLERNPIGWLEKRNWTGRITSLVWLAVMISFASGIAYETTRDYARGFNVLMWLLLASIAYVAAGSFRRERETGALELILVTPLSEQQIISGRLRALWNQFLPTFVLWFAVVLYLASALKDWHAENLARFAAAYLIVPIVGLYFSLRSRFIMLSWLATLTVCFAVPQLICWTVYYVEPVLQEYGYFVWDRRVVIMTGPVYVAVIIAVQLALAALLLWRLRVNLVRRSFSLR